MRRIQVMGPGCPACAALKENAETAVKRLGIEAVVEKVADIDVMLDAGVLMTPALVIDGELKSVGKVLSAEEITELLA